MSQHTMYHVDLISHKNSKNNFILPPDVAFAHALDMVEVEEGSAFAADNCYESKHGYDVSKCWTLNDR